MGQNSVVLLGHYGGDETHALSAWTSTSRELTDDKRARMGALLKRLAADGHHTPFEKSTLHFLVTSDIATHIHILKHRIGVSINAESARYRELGDAYYIPTDWPQWAKDRLSASVQVSLATYHSLLADLEAHGYSRKRAKESARLALPYAKQITSDVSFNFRSFAHFLSLRMDHYAQMEIRHLAEEMLQQVRDIPGEPFALTLEAFGY